MKINSRLFSFSLAIVSALAIVLTSFIYTGKANAMPGEIDNIETFEELEQAVLNAPDNSVLVITQNIQANKQLDISGKSLTIKAEDSLTISRQGGNSNFPVFHVGVNGKLTLGENLILTGDQDGNCVTYTPGDFASGTPDDPHGFFLEVDNGGVATLDGATLTHFITSADVEWAAPVVANGGEFNIKSGSIAGNSVGYTADNSKSTDGTTSDVIGVEEPDEPNTVLIKQWKRTNTAGGIIYNGGATGTFTGGSVNGNRGDTGAIVV
ncbi:MAG: hypothetical protein J6M18_02030 [Actinomycetaceae bacterium]|nr:hypothetical protein [Actinomycetaceae bacterium]